MADHHALDQLCAYCGVQGDYYDIWGNHHVVSPNAKLALLRAMNVTLANESEAGTAQQRLQLEEWRNVAMPVKVVFEGDPLIHLSLSLIVAPSLESAEWRLKLENGDHLSGRFSSLKAGETRVLGKDVYTRYDAEILATLPLGYHQLQIWEMLGARAPISVTQMIVCPRQCYQPPALAGDGRLWGLTVQLYSVRSMRNWGIGDFTDLKKLVEIADHAGAGMVGINPLHALFLSRPEEASPYSPSNRAALNILYLDIEAIADFSESVIAQTRVQSPAFQSRLQALREVELVNYAEVARAKFEILDLLYQHFRAHHVARDSARANAFRAFQAQTSPALRLNAVFDALQAHFHAQDATVAGWREWPKAFCDPASAAVAAFCEGNREQIEYFDYLQWQAELQLSAVSQYCSELGMPIGLYHDLAVGANGGGAEVWINADLYASEAHIGAPPDEFNPRGQDWGLPPPIPKKLIDAGYAPFITTLRAVMRHAGALRIDHVMGLMRLFWVAIDNDSGEGAYITYPLGELMGILALESQRQRCLIIGEDLGTVPDAVRSAMHAFDILSYRLLYFERSHGEEFKSAEHYPAKSLATIATHDLPTLRGFWAGADLEIRDRLALYPNEDVKARQNSARPRDRERLLRALAHAGLLTPGLEAHGTAAPDAHPALAHAVNLYLGRSPAKLLSVQPEDIFEQINQLNVPNTTDQYPNWRYKIALNLENWRDDPRLNALADSLRKIRSAHKL